MPNIDLLEDACARLPHTTRKMFGGHGLFAPNGGMFAGVVTDDQIILKLADEEAREELCALGTGPWVWTGGSAPMTMREWILVPDDFYDEPHKLAEWAARAHRLVPPKKATKKAVKARAKAAKPPGRSAKKAHKRPAKKASKRPRRP